MVSPPVGPQPVIPEKRMGKCRLCQMVVFEEPWVQNHADLCSVLLKKKSEEKSQIKLTEKKVISGSNGLSC